MALSPDSSRRFHNIQNELNRLFDELHSSTGKRPARQNVRADEWNPAMEVLPKRENLIIRVELPGVKQADVDIALRDKELTISGKRKAEDEEERGRYYLNERRYGSFKRSLTLPESVDESKITARLEEGLLTITVAGAGTVKQPKHIKIEGIGRRGKKKS